MKVGIISAMDSEHRRLSDRLEGKTETQVQGLRYVQGSLGENHLILTQCGIGKVNAAVGTCELIRRHRPDCIISTGVAGGIDPVLRVADVVVSRQVVYHDVWCGEGCDLGQVQGLPLFFQGCPTLVDIALNLSLVEADSKTTPSGSASTPMTPPLSTSTTPYGMCPPPTDTPVYAQASARIHAGLICTGDRFITDRAELNTIKAHFPQGLAVDMESGAIAQVCHLYGVPFISFRIISDTPGVDDHLAQYADFWGTMADRSFATTWAFLSALPDKL